MILSYLGVYANPVKAAPEIPTKDDRKRTSDLLTDLSSDEEASTPNRSESSSADDFRTGLAEMGGRLLEIEPCLEEKHSPQKDKTKDTYVKAQHASNQGDKNTLSSLEKLKLGESLPDQTIRQQDNVTLSALNLSVDARTCANPRLQKKLEGNAKTKTDDLEDKYKKETKRRRDEIKNFINKFVRQTKSAELQFFDRAIVNHKNDYESVKDYKKTIEQIMHAKGEDHVKIELYDSEVFEQSKIMVVQDVMERCNIVFTYLTQHFNSFAEEATGLNRLELGISNNVYFSNKRWILKPVHTQPSRGRQYRIPNCLITFTGIDWFDRTSALTKSQIVSVLKTAINVTKQTSLSANTNRKNEDVFGKVQMQLLIGPPFHEFVTQRQKKMISSYVSFNLLISHQSHDDFSLHVLQIQQRMQLEYGYMTFAGEYPRQQYVPGSVQMNFTLKKYNPELQPYPSYPQTVLALSTFFQSAGLDSERNKSLNLNKPMPLHVSQLNRQMFLPQQFDERAPTQVALYLQVPQNVRLSQNIPTRPPSLSQSRQNNFYQDQDMSCDTLHIASGDYMLDQRHNTPDRSQRHVVSRVTGKLILSPNLSTEDVETDNPLQELRFTCLEVFDRVQMQLLIGPPFHESEAQRQKKMNSSYLSFNLLISHQSYDEFYLHVLQIQQRMQLEYGYMTFAGEYPRQQYVPGSVQMNFTSKKYNPELQRLPSYPQTVLAPSTFYQTAVIDNQRNQSLNPNKSMPLHVSQLNRQMFLPQQFDARAMPQVALYSEVPQNVRFSQNISTHPSSSPQSVQNEYYQDQDMSRDALHSASGDYILGQKHNTPDSSQLHFVSWVTGKLITSPNLSTDDVEIDNPPQELRYTCPEVFGKLQMQLPIGPPFYEHVTPRQKKMNSSRVSFNYLMSYQSYDDFSLPVLQIRQKMQLEYGYRTFAGE